MAEISLAQLGILHDPLVGDPSERFHEVVFRLDGWLNEDQVSATATCPSCNMARCLSVTYDKRGVGLNCNSRRESDYDGRAQTCHTVDICRSIGLKVSDLFAPAVVPPAEDLSHPVDGFIMLRPELVAATGSVNAALALQVILYWWPRSTLLPRDGRRWVAISYEQMEAETGIKEQALRKTKGGAVPKLIDAGLIVRMDSSYAGKRTYWYSVEVEALKGALAAVGFS